MTVLEQLSSYWSLASPVVNSNFMVALAGGAIGAYGGAAAAQRITERGVRRRELLAELKQTNKAILLASQICNSALMLKKQFAKPLFDKWTQAKADFEYVRDRPLLHGDQQHVEFDLIKFSAPILPVDALRELVFKDLATVGRELSAVAEINRAAVGLRDAMAMRGAYIDNFAETPPALQTLCYFGLKQPDGKTDEIYPHLVGSILEYSDDHAWFSHTLAQDLFKHGQTTTIQLQEFVRQKDIPTLRKVDFSDPLRSGLLVDEQQYESWIAQFISAADFEARKAK